MGGQGDRIARGRANYSSEGQDGGVVDALGFEDLALFGEGAGGHEGGGALQDGDH